MEDIRKQRPSLIACTKSLAPARAGAKDSGIGGLVNSLKEAGEDRNILPGYKLMPRSIILLRPQRIDRIDDRGFNCVKTNGQQCDD